MRAVRSMGQITLRILQRTCNENEKAQLTRGAGQSSLADQVLAPTRTPSIACGGDRRACTWRLGRHHELEDLEAAGGRRITVMHAQPTHPRTHTLTHIPTYHSTQANCTRAACKLCARATLKAKTKKKANSNVNAKARAERRSRRRLRQRLARRPPAVSRWSLAASRCPPPAAKVKMTMSCVQLNSTYLSYHQCSSRSLPPWPGEKCSAQLKIMPHIQLKNMPRIHVKMICPMEKHASNSCDYDLSQLKNMPRSHVKTYRLELQI